MVAAAYWSGSKNIVGAAHAIALVWVGSNIVWLAGPVGAVWKYPIIDGLALIYFYRRWAEPTTQHRQLHFLLMCSYLATTGHYTVQLFARQLIPGAFGMSGWWFQLMSNLLFAGEVLLVTVYALLRRKAKLDPRKWRADTERWLASISGRTDKPKK